MSKATFGAGCFWGSEKFMGMLPGVIDVEVGYANGDDSVPGEYQAVRAHELALREGRPGRATTPRWRR